MSEATFDISQAAEVYTRRQERRDDNRRVIETAETIDDIVFQESPCR